MYDLDKLANLVGMENIVVNPPIEYCRDWRESFFGNPLALVFPTSSQQVMWIVQWCIQNKVELVPQGGNTSLCGGSVPNGSKEQLLISLKKMNKVIDINLENDSITVESGCTLRQVQDIAIQNNRLYPLSLASEKECTIGGNLSTNAGGVSVLKYGNSRELCLGLEAILADGTLYQGLYSLYKNNMGYDLKHLLIGAEGTLGIITKATLKLFPLPKKYHVVLAGMHDIKEAITLLKEIQYYYVQSICSFEIINRLSIDIIEKISPDTLAVLNDRYKNFEWYVLIEIEEHGFPIDFMNDLKFMHSINLNEDNILGTESYLPNQTSKLWQIRRSIPSVQKASGGNIKHDISLPLNNIHKFVQNMHNDLLEIDKDAKCVIFGHLGDGNLHYNVISDINNKPQIQKAVYERVLKNQGSIAAEHGIGKVKTALLKKAIPDSHYNFALNIKKTLDKDNLFNPNVIFSE